MADPVQENLLREIQEDLRKEKLEKLWKRYGSLLIAAAVAVVVIVAGYQGWRAWELSRREARSAAFIAAENLAQADPAAAVDAFAAIAGKGSDGYALLAGFRQASLLAEQGRRDEALGVYDRLAATSDQPLYRDLARLRAAALRLGDGAPGEDLDRLAESLAALSEDANPWRYSARELSGILAVQRGDTARARELFGKLESDIETPQGIRERASEMLSRLSES